MDISGIILLIVIGTTIWVGYDAKQNRVPIDSKPYSLNNGAVAWVLTCILLWIFGFPYYLVKRAKILKQEEGQSDLSQIEKLADLKSKGLITEKEFQTKKKEILGL